MSTTNQPRPEAYEVAANIMGYEPTISDPAKAQNDYQDFAEIVEEGMQKLLTGHEKSLDWKPIGAPFMRGDFVRLKGVKGDCVVEQCFDGIGGWHVIAKGPCVAGNPTGRYDYPVSLIERSPHVDDLISALKQARHVLAGLCGEESDILSDIDRAISSAQGEAPTSPTSLHQ